jgi:hypothetical protein
MATARPFGPCRVVLRDGAVLGVNIAAMIRQIMTLGLNPAAGREQRTDFAEAGGSFRIENGVVRNDDLVLGAAALRLEGGGTVDLPRRTLDYRLRPQLALTPEGRDPSGAPGLRAGVPFLHRQDYRPAPPGRGRHHARPLPRQEILAEASRPAPWRIMDP